jgi:hypothetical protein
MKRIVLLAALFLVAGCGRKSAFEDLKTYIAATPQSGIDAAHVAGIMSRLCRGDNAVTFLEQKAKSSDPEDAVAAYVILTELVAQARLNPAPWLETLVVEIQVEDLATHFKKFDTTPLTGTWQEWFSDTQRIMKENLEQPDGAVTQDSAPSAAP